MENIKNEVVDTTVSDPSFTPIDYRLPTREFPEDFSSLLDYPHYDERAIAAFFARNGLHLVCIQGDTFASEIQQYPDRDGKYFIGFAGFRVEFGRFFDSAYDAFTYILTHPVVFSTSLALITNHLFYESVSLQPIQKSDQSPMQSSDSTPQTEAPETPEI